MTIPMDEIAEEALDLPDAEEAELAPEKSPERKRRKHPKVAASAPSAPMVSLSIFCASGGRQSDQMAGFRLWAMKRKLGPRTREAWDAEYAAFMQRPV